MEKILVDLNTFPYDPVAKQIIKETSRKILKEDETDRMQIDKSISIHNTANDPVVMATVGIIVIQAIEDNT